MKRQILCVICFNEIDYSRMDYPGEHVKTVIGNLREPCRCDHCGQTLDQTAAVACVSIWTDDLSARGLGYYPWENDYIYPIDPLTDKVLNGLLGQPTKEAYGD